MRKVMGIIFQRWEHNLQQFTINRSIATIPFGGRYRLIDFPLSSLVNANIAMYAQESKWSGTEANGFIKLYSMQQRLANIE